ncbi:hypothetical protein NM688_g507 [Phlebia brevispora]|uniref:Uncharacterized protein n=1 Tax=Phlebia brevispora TaxID=194682 RepID=A0ACC1TE53_9APHY|nr:hypothetical protein NM688_g507 [Phlebia brevispora]
MVSAPSSSAQKQPLSYADSARKAQGIRNANASIAQRRQLQIATVPLASSAQAPSAGHALAMSLNSHAASKPLTDPTPLMTSPPPPETEPASKGTNGDSHPPSVDSSIGSSSPSVVKISNPPVFNVWNARKERMAQQAQAMAQSQQSRPTAPSPQKPMDSDRPTESSSLVENPDIPQPSPTPSGVPNGQHTDVNRADESSLSSAVASTAPPSNSSRPSKGEDAWSARPHLTQGTPPALPHLDDASAWPEVGKGALATASSSRSRSGAEREAEEPKSEGQETEGEHVAPRKSEKPKWVPIPPEELQAAVDAQRSQQSRRSGGHGRSRSQHRTEGRGAGATYPSASTSTSASAAVSAAPSVAGGVHSKGHSRAQSAVRDRTSTSRAPSVPQSQTQSRTGSVQSSPKHAARGKRLPEEDVGPVDSALPSAVDRSVRSSRAASPQSHGRPYLQVSTSTNINLPLPPVPVAGMYPAQMRGGSPRLPYGDGRGSPYYPLPPPPMASYPSSHSANSPSATPYPALPGYSTPPGPVPPYAGNAPYPPYPPYHYSYGGQAYPPYWAPPGTNPDANIPYSIPPHTAASASAPIDARRQGAAGPSSISGPGQTYASHSSGEASLPSNNTETSSQSSHSRKASEKGRTRVLSFGSIMVGGSTPASPAPGVAALDTAPETKPQAEGASSNAGVSEPSELGIESSFSRITTGAKSEVDSSETEVRPSGGEGASAGDQKSAVTVEATDAAAQDRKWEFGTARLPEDAGEKFIYASTNDRIGPSSAVGTAMAAQSVQPDNAPAGGPTGSASSAERVTHSDVRDHPNSDPFTVKDYGYGFGRKGGLVTTNSGGRPAEDHVPAMPVPPPPPAPVPVPVPVLPPAPPSGRPRRGSYNGMNGYDRGYDKGYGGRGRGRGRGYRGFSGRGGPRGQYPGSPTHRKPQVPAEFDDEAAYFAGMQSPTVAYMSPGYESYTPYPFFPPLPIPPAAYTGAPIPAPVTKVTFPLDWTRYHLLGQLEYYLGADNLAHDLFLRQKMDKRGWIAIHILASFPRVRTLTYDHQLVKDILTLSSLVEVKGDWVRIHRWEQYVLPDAPASGVEPVAGVSLHDQASASSAGGEIPPTTAEHANGTVHQSQNPEVVHAGVPNASNTYVPSAPYYGYYPPQGEYPAEYAGHNGGYIPSHRVGVPFNVSAEGQALSRENSGQGNGLNAQGSQVDPLSHMTSSEAVAEAQQQEESDDNEESEEVESDESEVEFVLGKDANRSWTPERKQG